jgi:hypothetical protein
MGVRVGGYVDCIDVSGEELVERCRAMRDGEFFGEGLNAVGVAAPDGV